MKYSTRQWRRKLYNCRVLFGFQYLTAVHSGFSDLMHGGPAENVAAVHLGFSDFIDGSPENLTAVDLGFSNLMYTALF